MQAKYSLKRQLLLWLLIPQLVLWLAGALLSFQVASHVANVMTDTSLQQTANALARQVHVRPDGQVTFDFPPAARDLLQGSLDDALMYRISTLPGGVLASNGQFEDVAAPTPTASHPEFYTSKKTKTAPRVRYRCSIRWTTPAITGCTSKWRATSRAANNCLIRSCSRSACRWVAC